jgi:hypothetical protein
VKLCRIEKVGSKYWVIKPDNIRLCVKACRRDAKNAKRIEDGKIQRRAN